MQHSKGRNKIYDFVFKDITVTPVIVFMEERTLGKSRATFIRDNATTKCERTHLPVECSTQYRQYSVVSGKNISINVLISQTVTRE